MQCDSILLQADVNIDNLFVLPRLDDSTDEKISINCRTLLAVTFRSGIVFHLARKKYNNSFTRFLNIK